MRTEVIITADTLERFSFGKNWKNFLTTLNEERIIEAENSLKNSLGLESLKGFRFFDVGSGSGLFSLAAYRLGADVTSFDYDIDSVNCTRFLREKFASESDRWNVTQSSVLDPEFLNTFGQFDIVYSWGVLHHTGDMYRAFENVSKSVKPGGYLFISIYNDQGGVSRRWKWLKKTYVNSGAFVQSLIIAYTFIKLWIIIMTKDFLKTGNPFKSWMSYKINRGMSAYYDVVDWAGGYPFEVATPAAIFNFFKNRNYNLEYMKTLNGSGCNEFVFKKLTEK
jgi:2-polyprenyl-6-hydroxyphenyl methylase/3-demethylubiquinone-9 3-methyltransferase